MKKHSTLRLYNYYDQNLLDCFTGVFNMNYEKISESEAVEEMKKHPFSV
jgi:hypothetical protein